MDLSKSIDFFDPLSCDGPIHIIGCGAVGSTVSKLLTRAGLTNITLYDEDFVEPHNIANQEYYHTDIGHPKTEALSQHLICINPEIKNSLRLKGFWVSETPLSGYVFLCVDNIELRRQIVLENQYNPTIKMFLDFRIGLTDGQHYTALTSEPGQIKTLLKTMSFSQEESLKETPVSACNLPLSISTTVTTICALGVSNFLNYLRTQNIKSNILCDSFHHTLFAL